MKTRSRSSSKHKQRKGKIPESTVIQSKNEGVLMSTSQNKRKASPESHAKLSQQEKKKTPTSVQAKHKPTETKEPILKKDSSTDLQTLQPSSSMDKTKDVLQVTPTEDLVCQQETRKEVQSLLPPATISKNESKMVPEPSIDDLQLQIKIAHQHILDCMGKINARRTNEVWNTLKGSLWEYDKRIIVQAAEHGLDIDCLKGNPTLSDRHHVIQLLKVLASVKKAHILMNILPPDIKNHPDVVIAACARGVGMKYLAKEVVHDRDLMKKAMVDKRIEWKHLLKTLKEDAAFALIYLKGTICKYEAQRRFDEVRKDCNNDLILWTEFACKYPCSVSKEVWAKAPDAIKLDRKIMRKVMFDCPSYFSSLDDSLKRDDEFFESLIIKQPKLLFYVPEDIFNRQPQLLTMKYLKPCFIAFKEDIGFPPSRNGGAWYIMRRFVGSIPHHFWENTDFLMNIWIPLGGHFPATFTLSSIYDNEEVLLEYAKVNSEYMKSTGEFSCDSSCYLRLSERLKSDKLFLRKLIKLTGTKVGKQILDGDWRNREVDYIIRYLSITGDKDSWDGIHSWNKECIRNKIREYEAYFTAILCETWMNPFREGGNDEGDLLMNKMPAVSVLNQGTDSGIKRIIASYLDFPLGEKLVDLILAAENVGMLATRAVQEEDTKLRNSR